MIDIPVWVLTFNRPRVLNRIIGQLIEEGFSNINILSNHPTVQIYQNYLDSGNVQSCIINSLNDEESNSWCARSWNTIFVKNFKHNNRLLAIQDDTTVRRGFGNWFTDNSARFDFMWGPAGDQWFYLTLKVLATAGWWDERYLACFCGDADFMRRVYYRYDQSKLSIEESHQWGFTHNPCGISNMVNNGDARPWIGGADCNQHEEIKIGGYLDPLIAYTEGLYMSKWGHTINERINETPADCQMVEVDWYPWFTKKYLHRES